MSRVIYILTTLFYSYLSYAECSKKIDPSKVMLFIDTNDSALEILSAEKAACERGERLVVVPKNYKEYEKYVRAVTKSEREMSRCSSNCQTLSEIYNQSYKDMNEFVQSQKSIAEATKEVLEEIKKQNGKIQNLTISGHNGGGEYGGYKGNMSREELKELMKDYGDINEAQSLLLLGCYTGVQKEILEWRGIFPKARLIAGYDGSAPLSDKPLGHQYITEILLKEKDLYSQADQKQLQQYTRANIQSLFQLNSAVFVNCDPENSKEFYYSSESQTRRFSEFGAKECFKKIKDIENYYERISLYQSGELEPPKETTGELRQIYNFVRANEHCLDILESPLEANKVFNLLFYDGIKKNFAKFYEQDLEEAQKILDTMNIENYIEVTNADLAKVEALKAVYEDKLNRYLADPEKYFKDEEKKLEKLKNDYLSFENKHPIVTNYVIGQSLDEEQTKILIEYSQLKRKYYDFNRSYQADVLNPEGMIISAKSMIDFHSQEINFRQIAYNKVRENPQILKEVWSPTGKNLSQKTRKELLTNLHNINQILTAGGLDSKQTATLRWINAVTSNHLTYLENPFSWHEFTPAGPEPLRYHDRLQDRLSDYEL